MFLVDRQSRLLSAADSLIREAAEIDLSLNPRESTIMFPLWTKDSLAEHPKEVSTPEGNVFPITIEGLKILGSPLGTCDFSELFERSLRHINVDPVRTPHSLCDVPSHTASRVLTG